MDKTVSKKDAFFMLDTSMEEDMENYGKEITMLAIKKINKDHDLYKDVKFGRINDKERTTKTVKDTCVKYAKAHGEEFGELFITELDSVDWDLVIARV